MINNQTCYTIGCAFCTGKIQRVNISTIQQACNPYTLTIWFIEHKITIKVSNGYSTWKVRVGNLLKHIGCVVVDKTWTIASYEHLCTVVGNTDWTSTANIANFSSNVRRIDFVQFGTRYNKRNCACIRECP